MKKKYGSGIKLYRIERYLYLHHCKQLAKIVYRFIYILLSSSIPPSCQIDEEVEFAHSIGIVIHPNSIIGRGSIIYQNVTIGNGKNGPRIGENCIIGAGAVVLGDIQIGDNTKVGANAVVLCDIPANCTVVGIPGKIVKMDGKKVNEN